jgi:hypothetical protein
VALVLVSQTYLGGVGLSDSIAAFIGTFFQAHIAVAETFISSSPVLFNLLSQL